MSSGEHGVKDTDVKVRGVPVIVTTYEGETEIDSPSCQIKEMKNY